VKVQPHLVLATIMCSGAIFMAKQLDGVTFQAVQQVSTKLMSQLAFKFREQLAEKF
jgi:hypothetical protein